MRFALLYTFSFLVSSSFASWNDSRPFSTANVAAPAANNFSYPLSNISSLAVTNSCQANCIVHFDAPLTYAWKSFVINTTVVAATVRLVVYPKYNVTKTRSWTEFLEEQGYTAQDRDSGTVSTTLTYGTLTNADGGEDAITEVITYPALPTASPASYWWSGVRPTTATADSKPCITQLSPATVQLPAHPYIARPTPAARNSSLDGTNYYLVSRPAPQQGIQSNDAILPECQRNLTSIGIVEDKPITTASFITVTVTATETLCKPELVCEVREEKTRTGGLLGPSGLALPPDSYAAGAAAPKKPQGAASPFRPKNKEVPGLHTQADKQTAPHPEKSATALDLGGGQYATLQSVRPEKPATSFMVPPSKGPQVAGVEAGPQTAQPMVTKAPATPPLGTVVVGSLTLAISKVPSAPVTFGPHVEQPALVAIGPSTITMGVAATFADQVIAIKTLLGGAAVAVLSNKQNGVVQTVSLNGGGGQGPNAAGVGGGGGDADLGGIFAPTPMALPQQASRPIITLADATLTPVADGGFSVAGTSLALGGPPITLYGSTGAGESAGSGSPGNKPSATVLSLTTNAEGGVVLVVNGKTSVLPTGPLETGKPKPAQFSGSSGSSSGAGVGVGSTGTGAAGASASHKSAASGRLHGVHQERWRCSMAAVMMMAMVSW